MSRLLAVCSVLLSASQAFGTDLRVQADTNTFGEAYPADPKGRHLY